MTPSALQIIRTEHQALAAVLDALRRTVDDIRDRGVPPDFEALRALLFYIDAYPERLHHPKETEHLFRRLRARSSESTAVLDRLEREHALGEQAIRALEHQLLEFEMLGPSRLGPFAGALGQFCDRYLEHMWTEEREIFPLAQKCLTDDDWAQIGQAFAANRDPLTGHSPDADFEALFHRIVRLLPPPLGIGPEPGTRA
ncbi:MAG: hemerythrin domain-containing protein [Burkholderiales bacterium]